MIRFNVSTWLGCMALLLAFGLLVAAPGCSKEKGEQGGEGGTIANQQSGGAMVAKVNGKKITEDMVSAETKRMAASMGTGANPQQMASMGGMLRKQAVEVMINRMLLTEAADKEGVTVPREQITARVDQVKQSFPSEQAFTERIAAMGMSLPDLEKEIEAGLTFEALLAKHTGEVRTPTADEVKAFYDSNQTQFQQPERVRASHILVAFADGDTDAQKAEKRAKAVKIREDLVKGADFAQTASMYSDCPSKENGGDLDYFTKGRMVKPFEDAAFALKVNQLSDIVETDFGYHIIKVTDHTPEREIPLDEARENIVSYLEGQQKESAVSAYIQSLRATAKIEYADTTGAAR